MKAVSVLMLVRREWWTAWNGPLGYAQRTFYAAVLLGGAALAWGALLVSGVRPSEQAEAARWAYGVFYGAQLLLATFLGTVSFARGLGREKERRTLDLLLLCPLSGFGILLGKMLGELLEMLAVLAAGLPILVFLLPLGGMTMGEVLSIHLILVGHLAAVGGLTALLSSLFDRPYRVMAAAWIAAFGFLAAPYAGRLFAPSWVGLWMLLEGINPLGVLIGELTGVWIDWGAALSCLVGGAAALVGGCFLGGLVLERRHQAQQERADGPGWARRILARGAAASGGWGRLFRPLFPIRHPLVARECALENDLRFRLGWIVFTGLFGGALALLLASGVRIRLDEEAHTLFMGASIALVLAGMIVLAAASVTGDKRSGRFEAMLASNVEPEELVKSKLAGLALRAAYLLVGPVLYAGVAVLFLAPSWEAVWRVALGVVGLGFLVATVLLVTVGIAVRCRGPAWAAALSLVLAVPPGLLVGGFVAATPVTFAVGLPLGVGFLLASYATVVRRFRAAALR